MDVSANGTTYVGGGNVLVNMLAVLIALGVVFLVFAIIFGIIWYIFEAIGLSKMSKNRDIEPSWLAWIPIGQNYLIGELIGNEVWGFGYANWILVLTPIITILINSFADDYSEFVSIIMLIVLIVFYVYKMTALYKLYQIYSQRPVLFLVISIIVPFMSSIFIFAIRNNEPNLLAISGDQGNELDNDTHNIE